MGFYCPRLCLLDSRWWPYKCMRPSQADTEDHDGRYGSGPAFTHTEHTHTEDAVGLLSKTTRSMILSI